MSLFILPDSEEESSESSDTDSSLSGLCWSDSDAGDTNLDDISDSEEVEGERQILSTKTVGTTSLTLVKGTINDEQVDVIVNSTSRDLNLRNGVASRALLSAGGQILQEECNTKYPDGISPGHVAVIKGGDRLKCKHVYNVCVLRVGDDNAQKILEDIITKCLTEADSAGLTSIALPALGTGFCGFAGEAVAKLMVRCICSFLHGKPSTSLTDIRSVVYGGNIDVTMAFQREFKKKIIDHTERVVLTRNVSGISVSLVVGQLIEQKCDVLVTMATRGLHMHKGTLTKILSEAAGPSLQQECGTKYPQGIQHGEIAVLGAGNIPGVKLVYCVAIPRYDKPTEGSDTPKQVLETAMRKCLQQAGTDGVSTIAFAILGSENRKFPDSVSAEVMMAAVTSVKQPSYTIRIVVHSDSNALDSRVQAFKVALNDAKTVPVPARRSFPPLPPLPSLIKRTTEKQQPPPPQVKGKDMQPSTPPVKGKDMQQPPPPQVKGKDMQQPPPPQVKGKDMQPSPPPVKVKNTQPSPPPPVKVKNTQPSPPPPVKGKNTQPSTPLVKGKDTQPSPPPPVKVTDMQSSPTGGPGKPTNPRKLGNRLQMFEGSSSASANKPEEQKPDRNPPKKGRPGSLGDRFKDLNINLDPFAKLSLKVKPALSKSPDTPARGTPEFCSWRYQQAIRPPSSWTEFTDTRIVKEWKEMQGTNSFRKVVEVDAATRAEVENLVTKTWVQRFVGHGRDALGLDSLGFRKLRVTKVERVENLTLYEGYTNHQTNMFLRAGAEFKYKKLEDIEATKCGAPATEANLGPLLRGQLFPEINEMYLFHGTKAEHLDAVIKHGIDNRLSSGEAMLGQGVYMAESSTKSDQYSDVRGKRKPLDTTMKMVLVRATMGDMAVTEKPQKWRKAPCVVADCDNRDRCSHENHYDSVVCDGTWNFREFVVYERQQAYPEFIIHYVRE